MIGPQPHERVDVGDVLDPFGDHAQTERMGQVDHGFHDRFVGE